MHEMRWYVVQSKPHHEARVAALLSSVGIDTFFPTIRGERRQAVPEPLFSQYLFVRCDVLETGRKIRYARGVSKILGTTIGPSPVDDEIIEAIRSRIDADGFVALAHDLKPGDVVRVTGGPLRDFVGVFHASTSASARIKLLLHAMSGAMRVVIDPALVRAAPHPVTLPRNTARTAGAALRVNHG